MWNEPTEEDLKALPKLYSTDGVPLPETMIHMHFFLGGNDWYVAEFNPEDETFFGYAILNDDYQNAEWGYVSLDELKSVRTTNGMEVDRDCHWKPTKASKIEKIATANDWK